MNERDFLAEIEKENDSSTSNTRLTRELSLQSNNSDPNLLDRVSQARPTVDTHDRLWAQMEMLNDDIDLAHTVQRRRGFLATEQAEALSELKQIQIELAQELTHEENHAGLDSYRDLWKVKDPDVLRTRLFNNRYFDLLDESVLRTAAKLDDIAEMLDASVLLKTGNDQLEPLPQPTPQQFEQGLVGRLEDTTQQSAERSASSPESMESPHASVPEIHIQSQD